MSAHVPASATIVAAALATLPSAGVLFAACAAGLVVVAVLALVMSRNAHALPLLALLALPFRLPISADGRTVNLLIPLYCVIAAGVLAHLLPRARSRAIAPLRRLEWLLAASVALYALQASYSTDVAKAAENVGFFYVPFFLLFLLLRQVDWTRELLLRCLLVAVALAVLFAGIGFIEYERKSLFLNPKVVAANQYDNYFRVNSVFFDPNIYGRFLAVVMIAVMGVAMRAARRGQVYACAAVLLWLLGGLLTSFSQSSIAALLLGLAVLAAFVWDVRRTVYFSLALALAALAVALAAPKSLHFGLKGSGGSASNATSGRTKLIEGGLELLADRPLYGYGSGSFEKQYRRRHRTSAENATSASHTIPVTVAAEQGIAGLALYVALLIVAFGVLLRGAGRSPPRVILAAAFAALVLHTWTYADFLEDPMTWALLAVGAALARGEGALASLSAERAGAAPDAGAGALARAGTSPGALPGAPAPAD
jgi:O-antigen ligase